LKSVKNRVLGTAAKMGKMYELLNRNTRTAYLPIS